MTAMIPFTQEAGAALLEELSVDYPQLRKLNPEFVPVQHQGLFLEVEPGSEKFRLSCNTVAAAGRGLGMALSGESGQEHAPFDLLAVMLDVSRNFVPELSWLKRLFRRLALLGFNCVMLYTEDTYQLDGEPFFGYLRGGYTLEELRELDRTARRLGIELVGCIQTLGHLEQVLKWNRAYQPVTDTPRVLLADVPETGNLLRKMIGFWSQALSSRRIHIGMDEAHDFGRGRHQDLYGPADSFRLFSRHLARVAEICREYGLEPMIWSDMYFKINDPERLYRNSILPAEALREVPAGVRLVYWDYYNDRQEHYTDFIEGHRQFGRLPIVASGIWTWSKLWYDHHKTRSTVPPCVNACRQTGVRELIFTMWGDDGGFCHWESASAGLAFAAECVYHTEPDNTRIARRFKAVAAADYGLVTRISAMEGYHRLADGYEFRVRAAVLLYDDPLLRIALRGYRQAIPEVAAERHAVFLRLLEELKTAGSRSGEINLDLARAVLTALERKTYYHLELDAAWPVRDRKRLARLSREVLPELAAAIEAYAAELRREWLKAARPFGLEVQQIRLAGAIARARETALRIDEFLSGSIPTIPELEAAPEPPWPYEPIPYAQVATASSIL